jgi:hypothetical protein
LGSLVGEFVVDGGRDLYHAVPEPPAMRLDWPLGGRGAQPRPLATEHELWERLVVGDEGGGRAWYALEVAPRGTARNCKRSVSQYTILVTLSSHVAVVSVRAPRQPSDLTVESGGCSLDAGRTDDQRRQQVGRFALLLESVPVHVIATRASGPPRCRELWLLMASYGLNVAWECRGRPNYQESGPQRARAEPPQGCKAR